MIDDEPIIDMEYMSNLAKQKKIVMIIFDEDGMKEV